MNFSHRDPGQSRPSLARQATWRAVRAGVWAVLNVALVSTELVADLMAPMLVLSGAIWWALPAALAKVGLDGQAGEIVREVAARIPRTVTAGGVDWTASGLLTAGFSLFVLVAACRTLAALATRLLLD